MLSDTDTKQQRIQKICEFAIAIGQCYAVVRRDTISQIDITSVVEPTHGKRLLTELEFENFWATRMFSERSKTCSNLSPLWILLMISRADV